MQSFLGENELQEAKVIDQESQNARTVLSAPHPILLRNGEKMEKMQIILFEPQIPRIRAILSEPAPQQTPNSS